ncbi:MAG: hypothetical protein IPG32_00245 [Saprospirales bacterium]|nr:hypothetical protein [Saprospirales bacterium]
MHRLFYLFAALAVSLPVSAQSSLLSDPDIVWMGTFSGDYRLDPTMPSGLYAETGAWNNLAVEKLAVPPLPSGFPDLIDGTDLFWKLKVDEALYSEELEFFEDSLLTRPLPEDAIYGKLSRLDTVISFDLESYEEKISIVRSDLSFESLAGVRILQQCYYRKSSRSIGYRAVSWAPLYSKSLNGSDSTVLVPICWLPAFPAENPDMLRNSEEVSYIAVTTTRNQSPTLDKITPVKGVVDLPGFFSDFIKEPWAPAYSADDFSGLEPSDLWEFGARMDTMVTFDIEPFGERMTISQSLPIEERIDAIRFTVRWFYDDRKRRLYYEFVGLAPTERFFDEKGEFMFSKAMFYLKGGK